MFSSGFPNTHWPVHPHLEPPTLRNGSTNPAYDNALSNHAPILSSVPLADKKSIKMISWSVMKNGTETEPQCEQRHKRIAQSLKQMARKNTACVIALQGIDANGSLLSEIQHHLGKTWQVAKQKDSDTNPILYDSNLFDANVIETPYLKIESGIDNNPQKKVFHDAVQQMGGPSAALNLTFKHKPNPRDPTYSFTIYNVQAKPQTTPEQSERVIKQLLAHQQDEFQQKNNNTHTNVVIGNFNTTVIPEDTTPTNTISCMQTKDILSTDGCFYQNNAKDSAPQQASRDILNPESGIKYTSEELKAPLDNITTEAKKEDGDSAAKEVYREIKRLHAGITLRNPYRREEKILQEHIDKSIIIRPAVNACNNRGVAVIVPAAIFEQIKRVAAARKITAIQFNEFEPVGSETAPTYQIGCSASIKSLEVLKNLFYSIMSKEKKQQLNEQLKEQSINALKEIFINNFEYTDKDKQNKIKTIDKYASQPKPGYFERHPMAKDILIGLGITLAALLVIGIVSACTFGVGGALLSFGAIGAGILGGGAAAGSASTIALGIAIVAATVTTTITSTAAIIGERVRKYWSRFHPQVTPAASATQSSSEKSPGNNGSSALSMTAFPPAANMTPTNASQTPATATTPSQPTPRHTTSSPSVKSFTVTSGHPDGRRRWW